MKINQNKSMLQQYRSRILTHITSHINPLEYYKGELGPEFEFGQNMRCPFHSPDNKPSFHVFEDGGFKCFGCEASGGGVVKFHQLKYHTGKDGWAHALMELYERYVGPLVSEDRIRQCQNNLENSPAIVDKIFGTRGIKYHTLQWYRCGLNEEGTALTVPYQSPYGLWTNLHFLNVDKEKNGQVPPNWNLTIKKGNKTHRFDSGRAWPASSLLNCVGKDIFIFEGYWDCLLALTLEIQAVTLGGAGNPAKADDFPLFSGKRINIVYDNDKAGRNGALKLAHKLASGKLGKEIRVIELPIVQNEKHNDFSDWVLYEKGSKEKLIDLVKTTEPYELEYVDTLPTMKKKLVEAEDLPILSLYGARDSTYNQIYRMEALVVGKATEAFSLPRKIRVNCKGQKKTCEACSVACAPNGVLNLEIDISEFDIIGFLESSKMYIKQAVKDYLDLPIKCPINCQVMDAYAVRQLYLAEPVKYESESTRNEGADNIFAYCSIDVNPNSVYIFKGYTASHPKRGTQVPILFEALPTTTEIEAFEVTDEVCALLKPFKMVAEEDLWQGLMKYYDHVARTVTGIWGRPLTHMAADLVFFSPVSFYFQGQFVRKASLDAIIFGDTRCGKGYIAEGLHRYYQAGEVISGENCTMMNLLGGIKREASFSGVAWGRMALRHRDTVIIDEMSGINKEDIGRLSRIRSEGIANIDKYAEHRSANANVGILWLTNPRDSGRLLRTYNYGIEALFSLQPKTEDMARFDYAHAVAVGEVPSDVINKATSSKPRGCKHTTQQCNTLITWAKSRTPGQVRFTESAVSYILNMAQRLGERYSASVPLLLAENARIKVAKIAASIAARIYNTDPDDPSILIVDERCAMVAVKFLGELYSSDTMGYLNFSEVEKRATKVDFDVLETTFKMAMGHSQLTMRSLCDKIMTDNQIVEMDIKLLFPADEDMHARDFLAGLKRANALRRKYQHYVKQDGFIKWLRVKIEQPMI